MSKEAHFWRTREMIYREKEGKEDEKQKGEGVTFSLKVRDIALHSKLEVNLQKSLYTQICSLLRDHRRKSQLANAAARLQKREKIQHQSRKCEEGLSPVFVSLSLTGINVKSLYCINITGSYNFPKISRQKSSKILFVQSGPRLGTFQKSGFSGEKGGGD